MMTVPGHDISAGDPIPPKSEVIQIHVAELRQIFNSIDPSPFRNRDLDPKAEEFIVGWAKDLGRQAQLALLVNLDRSKVHPDEATDLSHAIHAFFRQRALGQRQRLRELLHVGRTSLVIGLIVLAFAIATGNLIRNLTKGSDVGDILRQTLAIGGWVSMWRPLEIFLYDWWPIREEARLSDRLATMPVRIKYLSAATLETCKEDWPAESESCERRPTQPEGSKR